MNSWIVNTENKTACGKKKKNSNGFPLEINMSYLVTLDFKRTVTNQVRLSEDMAFLFFWEATL